MAIPTQASRVQEFEVYRCLTCRSPLEATPSALTCSRCHQAWKIRNGIPIFFEPPYYWGEIPLPEADAFLLEAERDGWRKAAERRFAQDEGTFLGVCDWQRTSWVPLLGLPDNSVALDIGSGHGAITHSLSQMVSTVYSLEAISERLAFTAIRLRQEGISNVHLLQASALDPPFQDGIFDLIVVNGVLEWVGLWAERGDPRQVQVDFLRRLRPMLKPEGVLLIGIENRFGFSAFRGALDHSGLPYTSLMPRRLATFYLRHSHRWHHRMPAQTNRDYRTYTYGERGYRKLLRDAGFAAASFFWPEPGYNQPYSIVPLQTQLIREHVRRSRSDVWQASRGGWRWTLKGMWSSLGPLRPLVSNYDIFAEPAPQARLYNDRLCDVMRERLPHLPALQKPACLLSCAPFGEKNVIGVYEAGRRLPRLIVKTSTPARKSHRALQEEYRNLELVQRYVTAPFEFQIPQPLGTFSLGPVHCTVESAAPGAPFSSVLRTLKGSEQLGVFRDIASKAAQASLQIAQALKDAAGISALPQDWLQPPAGIDLAELPSGRHWDIVQHGDFSGVNLFVERKPARMTIIDWQNLTRGAPPLYDVVQLLTSLAPIIAGGSKKMASGPLWEQGFREAFLGRGVWNQAFRAILQQAGHHFSVAESELRSIFLTCLVIRYNYYRARGSKMADRYFNFLKIAAENKAALAL